MFLRCYVPEVKPSCWKWSSWPMIFVNGEEGHGIACHPYVAGRGHGGGPSGGLESPCPPCPRWSQPGEHWATASVHTTSPHVNRDQTTGGKALKGHIERTLTSPGHAKPSAPENAWKLQIYLHGEASALALAQVHEGTWQNFFHSFSSFFSFFIEALELHLFSRWSVCTVMAQSWMEGC